MSFRDMVARDGEKVFLNGAEFAETHTIKYDDAVFEDVQVVLTKLKQSDRSVLQSDHMEGVYQLAAKAFFSATAVGGCVPKNGSWFEIDEGEALGKPFFRRYRVATTENAMGMICLELEAFEG